MRLTEWAERQSVGAARLHALITCKFGSSPSRQYLHKLLRGSTTPGLEVALLLQDLTNGLVTLEEMVVDPIYKTKNSEGRKESKESEGPNEDELMELLNQLN